MTNKEGFAPTPMSLKFPAAIKLSSCASVRFAVAKRLSNIYWVGGGSGSGKSAIAQRLARQHGMLLYDTDNAMHFHVQNCSVDDCPQLHKFLGMSMDDRWVNHTPEAMLESFHWYRGEGFQHIIDDLLALPKEQTVVVEGFRLLPERVLPFLHSSSQAAWLLPTAHFREMAFRSRGTLWDIPNLTSDPSKALENMLKRDDLFTEKLRAEVLKNNLNSLDIDENTPVDKVYKNIIEIFRI